jgi:hypothetical protein
MIIPRQFVKNTILNQIKYFSTYEKCIGLIAKSKNDLPSLTPLELALKSISSIILAPFGICSIKQNHIVTYYTFGKFDGYKTSGLKWIPPICSYHVTFCGDQTISHNKMHLTDKSGNPIRVSSYVIYNIVNPVNNKINLDSSDVLSNWIENITRQVISTYSYNELTSSECKENLMSKMIEKINLDPKAELYGIEVQRAGLLEINYAPEIAETMLVKQKAKVTIEARKELVDATLDLIQDIGHKLDDELTQEDKSKLITCLTVSMIGSQSPSQVINLN